MHLLTIVFQGKYPDTKKNHIFLVAASAAGSYSPGFRPVVPHRRLTPQRCGNTTPSRLTAPPFQIHISRVVL